MGADTTISAFRQPDTIEDPLTAVSIGAEV